MRTLGIALALVVLAAPIVALLVMVFRVVKRAREGVTFSAWLAELPQGPFKMFVACMLAVFITLAVTLAPVVEALLCMVRYRWFPMIPATTACTHLEIPEGALWAVVAIITAIGGFSTVDFRTKRTTYVPTPPGQQDVDDAKAGAQAPPAPAGGDSGVATPAAAAATSGLKPSTQQLVRDTLVGKAPLENPERYDRDAGYGDDDVAPVTIGGTPVPISGAELRP